jgi:2-polyprenyl-3-methyl-5-hydroxy-6-metoxy-1,4-benzoquinol methylase
MNTSSDINSPKLVYKNNGNFDLIKIIDFNNRLFLDVGCGAGDNSRLIKARCPLAKIDGITYSKEEATLAGLILDRCWVLDLEEPIPQFLMNQSYDCIIFSHVLEHLKNPEIIVQKFFDLLRPGGELIIAVPNILSWRMRLQFLVGNFTYVKAGELDETHLRFFTYYTADNYLFQRTSNLKLIFKKASGSFPLWILRRYLFPNFIVCYIDRFACELFPNLFGSQILIKAIKK